MGVRFRAPAGVKSNLFLRHQKNKCRDPPGERGESFGRVLEGWGETHRKRDGLSIGFQTKTKAETGPAATS